MENDLPKNLMRDVYWTFSRSIFERVEEFDKAVRQYQIDIKNKDDWQPNAKVFSHPSIQIHYDYWTADGESQVEEIFELEAGDGKFFSANELLFKINNAVAENVSRGDHIFFEGLTLSDEMHRDKPFYWMRLGS